MDNFYYDIISRIIQHKYLIVKDKKLLIGVSGSVSVGKTFFCERLKTILKRDFPDRCIDIMHQDSFLLSHEELKETNIKGKSSPDAIDMNRFLNEIVHFKKGEEIYEPIIYYKGNVKMKDSNERKIEANDICIVDGGYIYRNDNDNYKQLYENFDLKIFLLAPMEYNRKWWLNRTKNRLIERNSVITNQEVEAILEDKEQRILKYIESDRRYYINADILIEKGFNHRILNINTNLVPVCTYGENISF